MRLSLLLLPLVCLSGCMSDSDRAAPASPAAPSASTQATVPKPSNAAAPVSTLQPIVLEEKKPAANPVAVKLSEFTGPTENAELFGYDDNEGRIFLYSSGAVILPVTLSADGTYEIIVNASCDEADGQKAKFTVAIDAHTLGEEITCTVVEAKEYTIKAPGLKSGDHKIAITFLNDIYKENEYDLNFYIHSVTIRPAQ